MKNEYRHDQRLKLRQTMDAVALEITREAGRAVRKKKVFTWFFIFRLSASLVMPLMMAMYIVIGRYVDSGIIYFSFTSAEVFAVSVLVALIIILVFKKKSAPLRQLISTIVDGKPYTDEQVLSAYRESFGIPAYVTAWEFILSVLFILVPIIVMSYTGQRPYMVGLKELVLGWWLGTLSLVIVSYMFYQAWVEKALSSLYEYGMRISAGAGIERNSSIYRRMGLIAWAVVITITLLYSNMLYMVVSRFSADSSLVWQYMMQVGVMSVIILAVIFVFFMMMTASIRRSFDILESKMKMVQSGDYSVRILNNRDDQIGRLYDSFDYLVSTLNGVLSSLEGEVAKRTAKLEEVTSKISKYVSPQLYSKIYSDDAGLTLSYARKKLTIFFSDIAGFTSTSENLAPEDLSRILNQYLDAMAGIALKWGGTIDKYIGDAIMIFFGDPEFTSDRDHAVRCVGMALEMLGRLEELQGQWKASGITFPLHVRIGINTGYCTVGNFGSESRMDYTAIGGAVNLASRLESAAPTDGILVSEATYLLVNDSFACLPAGDLMLKGIDHPVKAWRVREKGHTAAASDVHIQGLDLSIDSSAMTDESRDRARRILKDAYDSLV